MGSNFPEELIKSYLVLYGIALIFMDTDARRHGFGIKYGLSAKCQMSHLMYLNDITLGPYGQLRIPL